MRRQYIRRGGGRGGGYDTDRLEDDVFGPS